MSWLDAGRWEFYKSREIISNRTRTLETSNQLLTRSHTLKKMDSPLPREHPPSIAPQPGLGTHKSHCRPCRSVDRLASLQATTAAESSQVYQACRGQKVPFCRGPPWPLTLTVFLPPLLGPGTWGEVVIRKSHLPLSTPRMSSLCRLTSCVSSLATIHLHRETSLLRSEGYLHPWV